MPVMRTYACPDCDAAFEFLHMTRDEPPPGFCPRCGANMGDEPVPLPPTVHIATAQTKAVDAVAQDYQQHHKVTDLKDGLRAGDVSAVPIRNPVTEYMAQAEQLGMSQWGAGAGFAGVGGKVEAQPSAGTLGAIQQKRFGS